MRKPSRKEWKDAMYDTMITCVNWKYEGDERQKRVAEALLHMMDMGYLNYDNIFTEGM